MACEAVVGMGWDNFVQVGLALAEIRDHELYREEFESFEAYCRAKWEYGRSYVSRLISAAQVFTHLLTSSQQKPDHETQVRPLVGLTLEQAQKAWQFAVEKAGGRKITFRLVKSAVKELQQSGQTKPSAGAAGPTKTEQRRLISDAFGELLMLLSQKAAHNLLTEKVELLHRHVQWLLAKAKSTAQRQAH